MARSKEEIVDELIGNLESDDPTNVNQAYRDAENVLGDDAYEAYHESIKETMDDILEKWEIDHIDQIRGI